MFNQEDNLIESGYVYNPLNRNLEHYLEQPPDYESSTYQVKEVLLEDLSDWKFTYWDGIAWQGSWDKTDQLPQMVKVNFKFGSDNKEQEFVVKIPVGP